MLSAKFKYQWEVYFISPTFFFRNVCLGLLGLVAICGCVKNIPGNNVEALKNNYSKKVLISTVPFIKQESDYCGPASLAMIFGFYGVKITQDEIAKEIYSPELKGTLSIKMFLYAIKKGFEAEMYSGDFNDLKNKIEAGYPLIVSHRSYKEKTKVHYLVVWGFDDKKEKVYTHSGAKKNLAIDYRTFLEHWNLANNLTISIHPHKT